MWLHFWAIALNDLKLTGDEFYDLTPLQLDALVKRHKRNLEGPEYMLAQIAAAIYNTGYRLKEQLPPHDFMPSHIAKRKTMDAAPNAPVKMNKVKRKKLASSVNALLMTMASANK